jgi:iron complex outermembrane receptor protein
VAAEIVMWPTGGALAQGTPASSSDATPTAATDDFALSEIVVTAQKRKQNLQDVGISVTAFSGSDVKQLGFTEPVSLAQQTPGVSFSSLHQGNATFNIRGVSQNDFADHFEPPVALYVDEAYVPHQAAGRAQLFDLDRVEILRGPQGTLFGRNATGGLVHLLSHQPTDNFESYVDVSAGEYGLRKVEAAAGGRIADGLRLRVAAVDNYADGWFKNRVGPALDDQNNYAGRLILDWDATADTTLNLKLHISRNPRESGQGFNHTPTVLNAQGLGRALGPNEIGVWPNIVTGGVVVGQCPGCDIVGYKEPDNDPRTGSVSYGDFHRTIWGSTLKLTSKLGEIGVTSITDYFRLNKYLDGDPDGAPQPFFRYITAQDSRDVSQELRFDGAGGGLRWQAGAYYLNMASNYLSRVDLDLSPYLDLPNGSAIGTTQTTYTIDVRSWALFSQAEYDINRFLTAIAGLRYTDDRKQINALFDDSQFTGHPATPFNASLYPDLARKTFDNVSARAELDWHVRNGLMLYGSYNRGHKGGNWAMPVFGLNPDPVLRAKLNFPGLPHDQEVLTSYEVGEKATFWGGRAKLNSSVYYYDYHNYQVFSLRDAVQQLFNRNASVSGGETEFTLTPTEGLLIQLGSAFMWERTVRNVPLPTGPADRQMPLSPDLTANALVRYSWPALGGRIAAQASAHWTDSFFFYAANEPITRQGAYSVVDARLSYTTGDDRWEFALWGKNLANTDYYNFRLDVGSLSYCGCGIAPPRWVGGTVSWHLE